MLHKREVNPPYFYSYSAFRQLSNDPPKPNAKKVGEVGLEHHRHHFDLGNHPKWTQPKVTTHQDQFIEKAMSGLRYEFKPPGATESTMKMEMDAERRLKSTVQADYVSHPVPPRVDLSKKGRNESGIVMGDDLPAYQTTYSEQMRAFRSKPDLKPQAPIRYDIITNGIKKIQETAPFDYWNPAKAKLRVSKNRMALPELKQEYNILNGWAVKQRQGRGHETV